MDCNIQVNCIKQLQSLFVSFSVKKITTQNKYFLIVY